MSAGNVLTGTASGHVAHAEDAYAAKPRGVRIEGRTVNNLWPAINTTEKGVTVTTNDAGIITLSGQNTASDNSFPYVSVEGVAAGKQCTLMVNLEALEAWRTEVDARLSAVEAGGTEPEEPEEPGDEYPAWKPPTCKEDAYYTGMKMTYTDGKRYECIAPEDYGVTWGPDVLPDMWREVTD